MRADGRSPPLNSPAKLNFVTISLSSSASLSFCAPPAARTHKTRTHRRSNSACTFHLSASPERSSATRARTGFGGRFTYNLTDKVALEAEGNFFPTNDRSFSAATGGNLAQAQFGVKAGKRFEKFGLFAKARPGFVSFSNTLKEVNFTPIGPPGGEDLFPTGASEEAHTSPRTPASSSSFNPSRRLVTRFDFGDTIILYGKRPGASFPPRPAPRRPCSSNPPRRCTTFSSAPASVFGFEWHECG